MSHAKSRVAGSAWVCALALSIACGDRSGQPGASAMPGAGGALPGLGGAGPGSPGQGGGNDTSEGIPNLGFAGSEGSGVAGRLPTPRTTTPLSEGWRFLRADAPGAEAPSFDDAAAPWEAVTVPHTYNALDGQDGGDDYYQGVTWYRRHFLAPSTADGRRVYLELDAANSVADVYLNGMLLGQHRGGFARFRFDATAALTAGDNLVAVKVDNSITADIPPLSADFTFFGGLYRDVSLLSVAALHLDLDDHGSSGVYLQIKDVTQAAATLDARVRVTNAAAEDENVELDLSVLDASGMRVARFSASAAVAAGQTVDVQVGGLIESPHLWDGRADPYLYTAFVELRRGADVVDAVAEPFGVRSFALDANTGFSLNGRYLDLYGVNRHQDRIDRGWAIGTAQQDEDMALISEIGATALRLAHYQHSRYFYDLSDRQGLVVWAEIPLVNAITDSEAFSENARQQMRELILQNYNHPSIVFWGIGNEQRADYAPANALLADLAAIVESLDPSRLSVYAHCCGSDTSNLTRHAEAIGYNYYFGWYMGTYDQIGPWADAAHRASPAARLALSEYGAGASLSQHEEPPMQPEPAGLFHPEEYQTALHEAYWTQLAPRPFIWAKLVWNMFDFAIDSRNEGDTPGRNDKGLVSYDRQTKKDAFFWYKANWSTEPLVHITGRRFNPRTTPTLDVKVFSNQGTVSLAVNGNALAPQTSADHIFRWTGVPLQMGDNQVEARAGDGNGGAGVSDSIVWTRQ